MSPSAYLEKYLREHILLSQAMQVSVLRADEGEVVLSAPLEPNINHHQTVFGGSLSALAMLAGWSSTHLLLVRKEVPSHIVIQSSSMEFLRPTNGRFEAHCPAPDPGSAEKFLQTLVKFGKSRLDVHVSVQANGRETAVFKGTYAALQRKKEL